MSYTPQEPDWSQASDGKWAALEAEPPEADIPSGWWARQSRGRQWLIGVGAAFVALMVIGALARPPGDQGRTDLGATTDKPDSSATITEPLPGNLEVYRRIAALTDCTELQREFDTAAADNDRYEARSLGHKTTLAYMEAANRRMEAVGCYKD